MNAAVMKVAVIKVPVRRVLVRRVPARSKLGIPLLLVLTGAGCGGPFSTLDPAGPSAAGVAWLWWGMFAVAALVLLAVVGLWLYAAGRRARTFSDAQAQRVQRRWLLGGGVVLPTVAIAALLVVGIPVGHNMLPLPVENGQVLRIDITGQQWWWDVRYPGSGIRLKDELHIPVGVPVDIHLTSADVVHSFWVPRLGGKLDLLPERTNILRLQADEAGTYRGQCAEFCGLNHAHMHFTLTAHEAADFAAWLKEHSSHD